MSIRLRWFWKIIKWHFFLLSEARSWKIWETGTLGANSKVTELLKNYTKTKFWKFQLETSDLLTMGTSVLAHLKRSLEKTDIRLSKNQNYFLQLTSTNLEEVTFHLRNTMDMRE
jgi:hypothetical protein